MFIVKSLGPSISSLRTLSGVGDAGMVRESDTLRLLFGRVPLRSLSAERSREYCVLSWLAPVLLRLRCMLRRFRGVGVIAVSEARERGRAGRRVGVVAMTL